MGAEGSPAARQAADLVEPGESVDVGFRRQRNGPLPAALRHRRGMPQFESTLSRHRPAGELSRNRGLTARNVSEQNASRSTQQGARMSLENSILMSVGGLTLDPVTKTPIVILKDRDNKLNLPIWIGLLEATAMATELEGIKMARPMTHDLLRNVLSELGVTVEAIEVTELRENTYFALIYLEIGGQRVTIDARPSDAISLALRTKSPIYVAKA